MPRVPPYSLGDISVLVFVLTPLLLAALLAWGTFVAWRASGAPIHRARRMTLIVLAAATAWMSATWMLASRGVLLDFTSTPPPFAGLVVGIIALAAVIVYGGLGTRLALHVPLWALVAVQSFRFPLELAMHQLVQRGIMPEQMSYTGRNFDIVTGLSAVAVAALARGGVAGRRAILTWNIMGLALLLNIVAVSIASTPRWAAFGGDQLNVFVMLTPFVWLPAVMVLAALVGHLLIFRALRFRTPPSRRREGLTLV